MKAVLIRSNLKEGLSAVERATGSSLPILQNILIDATEAGLRLTATNLEIAVCCLVAGKVLEKGSLTVPADIFSALIGSLPSERLELQVKDKALEIKTDNYEGSLSGVGTDDFPIIPKIQDKDHYIEVEGALLKDVLTQVVAASQALDLRPELGSVLFDFSLDTLKCVATDSFRLAERTLSSNSFKAKYDEGFRALVPLKAAQEIIRIVKNDDTVRIHHDQSQIFFVTKTIEFVSRLVDANFPDYSSVVPKTFENEVVVDRQELMNAVKLASVLGSRNSEVKLIIDPAKKALEVFSSDQTSGENRYKVAAKISGEEGSISFNWRYLMDGLRVLKGEDITLGLYQENKKVLMRDTGNAAYFYILASLVQ